MFLIKLILKLLLLPVIVLLTLGEWIGIFLTSFSSIITNLLSGIIFFIAILSYPMNIATGQEVLVMMISAFVIFILPYIAAWMIARIMILKEMIKDFIRS